MAYGAYQRGLYKTAFLAATARLNADSGDAPAMTLIGELYNQGLGVRQDPAEAARWYQLAARAGDAHAMASLGLMAIDGRGIAKDPAVGRNWLEQAATKGEPTAAYNLALILLSTGSGADIQRAANLLKIAVGCRDRRCTACAWACFTRGPGSAEERGERRPALLSRRPQRLHRGRGRVRDRGASTARACRRARSRPRARSGGRLRAATPSPRTGSPAST
jgi:hypothetical protein